MGRLPKASRYHLFFRYLMAILKVKRENIQF